MWVVAHLSKSYDFVPVPDGVKVTLSDIAADRVRPVANGGYKMRIEKPGDTVCTICIPEKQVIAKIIHEKTRQEGGRTLTRNQAIAFYVGEEHLPKWAKKSWITKFVVHDDGPDEEMLRTMLAPHAVSEKSRVDACKAEGTHDVVVKGASPARCGACGHMPHISPEPAEEPNIPAEDHQAHVDAYMQTSTPQDLVDHLYRHFKVKAVKP